MSIEDRGLAYQFFSGVLKGKGVDQPTIDFVWEQGETLFLWHQWFGDITKADMQKLGELTETVVTRPQDMPPLTGHGIFKFNEIAIDLSTGKVEYRDNINRTGVKLDIENGGREIQPGQVLLLGGMVGEIKVRTL